MYQHPHHWMFYQVFIIKIIKRFAKVWLRQQRKKKRTTYQQTIDKTDIHITHT